MQLFLHKDLNKIANFISPVFVIIHKGPVIGKGSIPSPAQVYDGRAAQRAFLVWPSLHRHGFRQVPGFVDIAALFPGGIIGQQLQRHHRDGR